MFFSERIRRCSSNSDRNHRCVFLRSAIPLIDTRGSIVYVIVAVSVDINHRNCRKVITNDYSVVPTYSLRFSLEIVVTLDHRLSIVLRRRSLSLGFLVRHGWWTICCHSALLAISGILLVGQSQIDDTWFRLRIWNAEDRHYSFHLQ